MKEQLHLFLRNNDYVKFFSYLDDENLADHLSNQFCSEFLSGRYDYSFNQRLQMWVDKAFKQPPIVEMSDKKESNSLSEQVRSALGKNKLETALDLLPNDNDDVVLLRGRYHRNQENHRLKSITLETYHQENDRLVRDILDWLKVNLSSSKNTSYVAGNGNIVIQDVKNKDIHIGDIYYTRQKENHNKPDTNIN